MSDPVDPFGGSDPDAVERARRRQQREAKRRGRDSRQSIADRVSGALDGAAARGREAAEQAKERAAAARQSEPDAPEPPPLRRPRAAPPEAEPRSSPLPAVDHGTDDHELPPPPVSREAAGGGGSETSETGSFVPAAGAGRPRGPRRPPPEAARRRRLLAGAGVLIVGVLGIAAFMVGKGGDDPAPPAAKGAKQLKTVSVTIPEGLPRSEVDAIAADAGLKGKYEKETANAPKGFDLKKLGAPSDATLEGFLFPATYEVEKGAAVDNLIDSQLTAFNENLSQIDLKAAEKKNLSVFDVVTIASMVEREVSVSGERSTVASVIYNRLKEGIPLQIDATVRYGIGNDFSRPLTESDLQSDSPYNTYQVPGLPAGPIGNPGLDSLEAAADPKDTDFLYYVVKPGTCGEHFFTDDYDEFVNASNEYDAAQAAEGGSPTEC